MIGPNFAHYFFSGKKSSSGTFIPSDIPNLTIWYKADNTAYSDNFVSSPPGTACVNNSNVVSWKNISNNVLNSYGAALTEPTFKTNIQNSLPSVRFNGTDEYLVDESIDAWNSNINPPFTVFFCFNATNTGGIRTLMNMQSDVVANNKLKFLSVLNDGTLSTSRQVDDLAGERTLSSAAGQITNGTSYVVCVLYNGTTATIYKNGTSVASSDLGVDGEILQYIGGANKIGASGDGTIANYFAGDIFEIVGYEFALTGTQFTSVDRYLGTKWGITVA